MATGNPSIDNITDKADFSSLYSLEFEQFLRNDIPAVVFLTILSAIGTVGNVHTLLVYSLSKQMLKVPIRTCILLLSATDLIPCIICIPFEIYDLRYSYTFTSEGSCKFFRFLNHAVSLTSGGLLTVIAIERYSIGAKRLPCHRLHCISRVKALEINIVSVVVVGISLVLSIPALVFYGRKTKDIGVNNITGTECAIKSEYQTKMTAVVYTGIILLLSTISCLICFVVYGKILFKIVNQMRGKHKKKINKYAVEMSSNISSIEPQLLSVTILGDLSQSSDGLQRDRTAIVKAKPENSSSKYEHGRRLTISLIVATAVSYLGYIIFASTILVKMINPKLYKYSIRPATNVLLRAFFINNAVNPVVFCFVDKTFRVECLKLYSKTICRKQCLKNN